jgi:hypothetical protein
MSYRHLPLIVAGALAALASSDAWAQQHQNMTPNQNQNWNQNQNQNQNQNRPAAPSPPPASAAPGANMSAPSAPGAMRDTTAPGSGKLGPGQGSIADTGPGGPNVQQVTRTIGSETLTAPAAEIAKWDQLDNITDPTYGGFPAGDAYVKQKNELDRQQAAARAPFENEMSSIQAAFNRKYNYWPGSVFSNTSVKPEQLQADLNLIVAGHSSGGPYTAYQQALFEAQVKISRAEISIARIDEGFVAKRAALPTRDQLWAALQSAKDQQMAVLRAATKEAQDQNNKNVLPGLLTGGGEKAGPPQSAAEQEARARLHLNESSATSAIRLSTEGTKLANDRAKLNATIASEIAASQQSAGCTSSDISKLDTSRDTARNAFSLAQSKYQQERDAPDGDPARLQAYSDTLKAAELDLIHARDAYDKAYANRRDIEQTIKDKYADDVKALDQKSAELQQRTRQEKQGGAVYHDVIDDVFWDKKKK